MELPILSKPSISAAMIGTVPAQKVAIKTAPHIGLPVPAAVMAKVYSQPHGMRVVKAPMVSALGNGGRLWVRRNAAWILK